MSDNETNKPPAPPKWQMRLFWATAVIGILIVSQPLLDMDWYMGAAVFFWIGFNAATIPRTKNNWRAAAYLLQLFGTAFLLIVGLAIIPVL